MSEEEDSDECDNYEGPFDFALLGIVKKPCKDDIKHTSSQEDAKGPQSSPEEERASKDEDHTSTSAKKRTRRTVKPKAKGSKPTAAAAAASSGCQECPHCQKEFKKPSALVVHLRSHNGEKPFHCETCDKGFSAKSGLYVDLLFYVIRY
jgi:uncharacterized Zn-finger protein